VGTSRPWLVPDRPRPPQSRRTTRTASSASSSQAELCSWRQQVSQEIAALRVVASEAQALTPPEALAGPHQRYLDALTQLDL